jgi:DNA-binding transcriptional MerR regulator
VPVGVGREETQVSRSALRYFHLQGVVLSPALVE